MPKVIEPKVVDASEVTGEAPGRPSTAAGSPVRFPSAAPQRLPVVIAATFFCGLR
jgi:hypothetical protein